MRQGEIWLVVFDPAVGDELNKTRRAVVVNRRSVGVLALRTVVPLTEWKDHFEKRSWMVRLDPNPTNRLTKTVAADTFQIRTLSTSRFDGVAGVIGELTEEELERVLEAIKQNF